MDDVNSHVNGTAGNNDIISPMQGNQVEMYTRIINQENVFDNSLKSNITYEIAGQELSLVNDYQVTLKCLNNLEKDPKNVSFEDVKHYDVNGDMAPNGNIVGKENETMVKMENINNFKTTDDECMAVEALRQLGGMYNNVVPEQDLSLLSCNLCDQEFTTSSDLHNHFSVCKGISSFICSNCQEVFDNKHDFNVHSCFLQETLSCKYCNQNFFCKKDLLTHINLHHDRPYKCHICNLRFPRTSSLKNHLKIHTYIPGRALFNFVSFNDQNSPTEVEPLKWNSDQLVYIDKSSLDPLNTFNYGTATCLVQTELNSDINLAGPELVVNTYEDSSENNQLESANNSVDKTLNFPYNNDLNFAPIKMEASSFLSEVDKMDETFPISSLPQMEVTIGSDVKRPHTCPHCGATFTRAKALSSHLKLHSIGWPNKHECESCGESFSNEQLKLDHKENCILTNTLLNTISENNKISDKPEVEPNIKPPLNVEIKRNFAKPYIKVGKHSCPECQKKFTTKQKMYRHMWIHRRKTYSCEMCSMSFEVQVDLDKHRLSQHPTDSPYVCQECGKCFASRQGLWEHGRVHGTGNAGLFQCMTCSKTFASRQGYLIHNRTHTGERPYGCRFCMKAFRDGGTLRKHERIHTGERPHVCPICMHDFNQKVVLREHVRWVHVASKTDNGKGYFECQICNFTVKDKEELCAHIVRHSDQMAAVAKVVSKHQKNDQKDGTGKKLETLDSKKNNKKVISRRKIKKEVDENLSDVDDKGGSDSDVTKIAKLLVDDKNFVCDMCRSNFSTQKELMMHVRIHI